MVDDQPGDKLAQFCLYAERSTAIARRFASIATSLRQEASRGSFNDASDCNERAGFTAADKAAGYALQSDEVLAQQKLAKLQAECKQKDMELDGLRDKAKSALKWLEAASNQLEALRQEREVLRMRANDLAKRGAENNGLGGASPRGSSQCNGSVQAHHAAFRSPSSKTRSSASSSPDARSNNSHSSASSSPSAQHRSVSFRGSSDWHRQSSGSSGSQASHSPRAFFFQTAQDISVRHVGHVTYSASGCRAGAAAAAAAATVRALQPQLEVSRKVRFDDRPLDTPRLHKESPRNVSAPEIAHPQDSIMKRTPPGTLPARFSSQPTLKRQPLGTIPARATSVPMNSPRMVLLPQIAALRGELNNIIS